MMTTTNGNHPTTIATVPTIEAADPRAALDAWDAAIAALDAALTDTTSARAALDAGLLAMERIEAGHVLAIEGANAETRKARLTLALADDARHEAARCLVARAGRRSRTPTAACWSRANAVGCCARRWRWSVTPSRPSG